MLAIEKGRAIVEVEGMKKVKLRKWWLQIDQSSRRKAAVDRKENNDSSYFILPDFQDIKQS